MQPRNVSVYDKHTTHLTPLLPGSYDLCKHPYLCTKQNYFSTTCSKTVFCLSGFYKGEIIPFKDSLDCFLFFPIEQLPNKEKLFKHDKWSK